MKDIRASIYMANQGRGEEQWDIHNTTLPCRTGRHGTRERWSAPNGHLRRSRFGRCGFSSIAKHGFAIGRFFDLALDSKLRGCDLVKIKIGDVVSGAEISTRSIVIQHKTGRPVQFELTADVRTSLLAWLERRGGTVDDYAFPSRVDRTDHLSTPSDTSAWTSRTRSY